MFNTSVTDYNESDLHNCPQVSSQVWHEHYGTALERTPPTGPRSPPRHAKGSACWSHKKLTNRLESFDFFLCRWKYVHLPFTSACPSRQLKCTLSQLLRIHMTFYETVMFMIIVMWSGGCCFCCYHCCCCCWRWKAAGPSLTKRFLFFHLTTPFFLSFPSACLLCLFQD